MSLHAGDKIQFSGPQTKVSPSREKQTADTERLPSLRDFANEKPRSTGQPGQTDTLPLPGPNPQARKMELERLEKKYFLLYDEGELQREDKQRNRGTSKIFDDTSDDSKGGKNWLFDGVSDSKKQAGKDAKSDSARQEAAEARSRQDDDDADRRKGERNSLFKSSAEPQAGTLSARDSDMKGLFNPAPSRNDASSGQGRGETSLRDAPGGDAQPARSKAQQERMSDFRQMLNGANRTPAQPDATRSPASASTAVRGPDSFNRGGPRDAFSPPVGANSRIGDPNSRARSATPDGYNNSRSPLFPSSTPSYSPNGGLNPRSQPTDLESTKRRFR